VQPLAVGAQLHSAIRDRECHTHFEAAAPAQEVVQATIDQAHHVLQRAIAPRKVEGAHCAEAAIRGGGVHDIEGHIAGVLREEDALLGQKCQHRFQDAQR